MKKPIRSKFQRFLIPIGAFLILSATVVLIFWQANINVSESRRERYVNEILSLIPQQQNAYPEERRDNTMSALSLDGTDFVGLIEMPLFNSILPVCGKWGNSGKYPSRFYGSIFY